VRRRGPIEEGALARARPEQPFFGASFRGGFVWGLEAAPFFEKAHLANERS
jgi:hypothetical protein